ncbi:MAG: hypothetical protein ACHQIM_07055 [Sphingobacteriales bacterium]
MSFPLDFCNNFIDMVFQKPFLLIIELKPGYNSHGAYTNYDEATKAKEKAITSNQEPICIYNLNSMKYLWANQDFPMYGETIANSIIISYTKRGY